MTTESTPKSKKRLRLKPRVWDTAFFIGGLVMGKLISILVKDISFLRWLSFEVAFGVLDPVTIDLVFLKFTYGFGFYLSPAIVLFTILFWVGGKLLRTQVLTPAKPISKPAPLPSSDDNFQQYDN